VKRRELLGYTPALVAAGIVIGLAEGAQKAGGQARRAAKAATEPDTGFRPAPRLDRFFPLSESFSYPGSGFVDMTVWLPGAGAKDAKLRVWMKTGAAHPAIDLFNQRLEPAGKSSKDPGWVDFGLLDPAPAGFACMRVYGLSAAEAATSCVVITPQTDVQLSGAIRDAERTLCGISRDEVGRTTISPDRVTVRTPTEFTLCYEAGPQGLPPGSLVRLAFAKAFSMPQQRDREAAGWIEVAKATVPVELASVAGSIESHERNDAFFRLPKGLPAAERILFRYKTDFVYLFSHRWAEVDRKYWWSELPPMALAVAVDDRRAMVPPLAANSHAVDVVAGPPARLLLFLPGRVRQGEPHSLGGTYTDRYRNAPSPGPVESGIRLRLRGEKTYELGGPENRFTQWYRFSVPLPALPPGVYRAQAYDPRDPGAVRAESNPMEILAPEDKRPAIYWGQIHCHSERSDGTGPFEDIYRYSRNEGCLDFAAGSDHAEYFTDNEWQWMQDVSNRLHQDGRFVTLNGYERAGDQGHWNFYTSADRLELFRGMNMDPGKNTLQSACERLAGRTDVVVGPHVSHGKYSFEYKSDVQRFYEICSMWGLFEKLAYGFLRQGAVIGMTGGGDNHEARGGFSCEDPEGQGKTPHTFAPGLRWKTGLTAALMPRLERKELILAVRDRRTYATTGPRILVDFAVAGIDMGGQGKSGRDAPRVTATVHAEAEIARVEVVRDGEVAQAVPGTGADQRVDWPDAAAAPGRHWYLLKVVQKDGETVWTSPVWIDRE